MLQLTRREKELAGRTAVVIAPGLGRQERAATLAAAAEAPPGIGLGQPWKDPDVHLTEQATQAPATIGGLR
jgi:hypothetical protein